MHRRLSTQSCLLLARFIVYIYISIIAVCSLATGSLEDIVISLSPVNKQKLVNKQHTSDGLLLGLKRICRNFQDATANLYDVK
ncbi:hypothetical protein ANTQUA_LOCUS9836 [Anthophora quadrimaculata]